MPGVEALIYDHEFSDYEEEPPKRPHLVLIYSQDSNEFYEIQDENPDTEDSADVENEDIDAWDELEDYPQVKKMRLSSAEHSEALRGCSELWRIMGCRVQYPLLLKSFFF